MSVTIRVPATSANVGVGFDCLGIALDLEASFHFEASDDGQLHIAGCPQRFRGADNLVWTSYLHACRAWGLPSGLLSININSPIPLAGGLGSSSACIVAGICAAQLLGGQAIDRKATLRLATSLEGHPDNIAPAVLGGLVCSFVDAGEVTTIRFDVADKLRFVAIVPPYEVRTSDARRVLPSEVPLSVAVWQTGRCVAMVHALEAGDAQLIAACAHDRLHEPYRAKLIPDYEAFRSASLAAGASAFVISGSGATMLAICDGDAHAKSVIDTISAMESVAEAEGGKRGVKAFLLHPCSTGAVRLDL
ncbi:MAG: homoserine kinase [Atopobiaceae bacterium]|jgi:homoserine kinase